MVPNPRRDVRAAFVLALVVAASPAFGAEPMVLRVRAPDVRQARLEDARESRDAPPRFALPVAVHVDLGSSEGWEPSSRGQLRKRLRIEAPGASSTNLGFGRFRLPEGAHLRILARSGGSRPFTDRDNAAHGELWTPVLPGELLEIILEVPEASRELLTLVLTSVGYGYRSFGAALGAKSGACNVDVVCPVLGRQADLARSVAVFSLGGSRLCTGTMLNNTAGDLRPYFLTADHCGVTAGNAPSVVTYWNYQNHFCRPVGSASSGSRGDGALTQFETGAWLRARAAATDFALLELDAPPNPAFGIRYAGWSRAVAPPACTPEAPCAALHHPGAQEKRISLSTSTAVITSYLGDSSPGDGTHIRAFWSLGVTEPGSSGSALFDPDGRVVGQLHGGPSHCAAVGDALSDYYGWLVRSWDGAGPEARLVDWLDPTGSGATTLDAVESPHRYFGLTPCRLLDTRRSDGPLGGPALVAGASRIVRAHGACGVPSTARAIAANLTVTEATATGHLLVDPAAQAPAFLSVLAFRSGLTRASNSVVSLGAAGAFSAASSLAEGQVHLVVDVSGYFE